MNLIPILRRKVGSGLFGLPKSYTTQPSATPSSPPSSSTSGKPPSFDSDIRYPLTKTKKILCVWAKRYPSLKEVPDHVSPEVWSKVRSIVRIKLANYTMICILMGCVGVIVSGKRARDRGESLVQRNLDWHKKYSESNENEVKNLNVFGK